MPKTKPSEHYRWERTMRQIKQGWIRLLVVVSALVSCVLTYYTHLPNKRALDRFDYGYALIATILVFAVGFVIMFFAVCILLWVLEGFEKEEDGHDSK